MQLEKLNWDPFLYKKLQEQISANASTKAYMVFDFDQTIVTGDVEENLMFYMARHFLYKLSSEEFAYIVKGNLKDDKFIQDLTDDLVDLYKLLFEDFVENSEVHQSFMAKMITFYYKAFKYSSLENGKIFPIYTFAGLSQEEMDDLTKNMLGEMTTCPIEDLVFSTSPKYSGKAGLVEGAFYTNLRFKPEILNLFKVLKANKITAHIISATPQPIVEGVVKASPLEFSADSKVFGMPLETRDGKISPFVHSEKILTRKEGKSQVIISQLKDLHKGKDPLGVFGDSMGDYHMLTSFEGTKIRVLFDRNLEDDTKLFKKRARVEYGKDQASYFIQSME